MPFMQHIVVSPELEKILKIVRPFTISPAELTQTAIHWQIRHAYSEITYQKRYDVEKLQSEDHGYAETTLPLMCGILAATN